MLQKNWDKYEVALLIEVYQNIKQGRVDRNTALVTLSQNLRQMAINEGLEIDDTFRNLNGMQWQMGNLEKLLAGNEYDTRAHARIFVEVATLYKENPHEFQAILTEAHSKIVGKEASLDDRKQLFIEWLAGQNIPFEAVIQNIEYVCEYAIKRNITKKNVWDIDDSREFNVIRVRISGNRLFKLMHGKEHRQFEKNGKLYSDFLKANSEKAEMPIKKEKHPDETIAETAVTVPQEPIAASEEIQSSLPDSQKQNEQVLDLCNIPDLSYTKPTFATFKGIELDAYNWKIAYISVLHILYRVYSVRLNNYIGKSFGCGTRIDLSYNSADLISPRLISSEHSVYAESNLSAYDIAKRIAIVLKICEVSYDRLVIKYKRKGSGQNEDDEVRKVVPEKTESQRAYSESIDATNVIDEYVKWLAYERGLSENTSRGDGSTLRVANIKAQEMGSLDGSLFDVGDENLKVTIESILSDNGFAEYNAKQHNRFSAALNAYLMFKTGESVSGIRARKHNKSQEAIVCPEELKILLLKKFPYGIRIDSEIDNIKLKNFAEMFEVTLSENEELLKAQISASGILFDGKIYFVSDEVYSSILQKINDVFAEGFSVIYYEELLNRNFDWFDENHISSWELLREILDRRSDDLFISKNFLRQGNVRINEADAVEKELEGVWGEEVIHTYDEMYPRLPYIPDEKIKFYLSYCKKFVWSTHETFAWIDKVIISEEEKHAIIDYVESECELNGHASIANVPLGKIEEENYQISITAIYDAVYRLVLSDKFSLSGKILTKIDAAIDALTLAKTYCADKEECSFEEINNYVISINGLENRQITFRAAYDQMTRISKEKFVADEKVHFDIDAIDELLEQMIKGDFASIKSIATFIMFPNCGYTWTHYLLESFCYRFSKKYRLDVIGFNDRNAGIIAKKEVNLSYVDMLAITALRSGLELRADIIGEYLYNNGYIARRRGTILNNTVERAIQMKEGR